MSVGGRWAVTVPLWRGAFWGCVLAVLTLALMPGAEKLPTTGWDKSNHLIAFVTLTLLGGQAYATRRVAMLVGLVCFGGLIEALQSLTPDRFAEWIDWLADLLGIALAVGLQRLWAIHATPVTRST